MYKPTTMYQVVRKCDGTHYMCMVYSLREAKKLLREAEVSGREYIILKITETILSI